MTRDPKSSDTQTPSVTIVGGQPGGRPPKRTVQVPVGLEQLLFLAAGDAAFRARLLADRKRAVAESKISLRPSEQTMLETVGDEALNAMIAQVVPENPRRRKFMGMVAAAAASLAAGAAVSSCAWDSEPGPVTTGVDPNDDDDDSSDQSDDDDSDNDTDSETDTDGDTDSDSNGEE